MSSPTHEYDSADVKAILAKLQKDEKLSYHDKTVRYMIRRKSIQNQRLTTLQIRTTSVGYILTGLLLLKEGLVSGWSLAAIAATGLAVILPEMNKSSFSKEETEVGRC